MSVLERARLDRSTSNPFLCSTKKSSKKSKGSDEDEDSEDDKPVKRKAEKQAKKAKKAKKEKKSKKSKVGFGCMLLRTLQEINYFACAEVRQRRLGCV